MQKKSLISLAGIILAVSSCTHLSSVQKSDGKTTSSVTRDGKFEVIPFLGNFTVKRATFQNGLKLMILKDPSSPTFAYQTWFKVGSRNEVVGKTGLAHLFEHLMFKGTTHHPEGEFDALLEQAGAEDENAFTSNDHTVYVQELPKDSFDLISGLESDRMVNLIVNDASFKTEREVVQNERRFRKENSAEGTIYQTLFETAFTEHPYHWPVIGYEQDLTLMSAQDARDFYERYYSPDRATIVVVGDVDEDAIYRKVEKLYGGIPGKRTPDGEIKSDSEQTAQRRKRLELNTEVEKIWLAFKVPALNSPDAPIFESIQGLLSEGKNGRLNRALVDSGIATEVGSGSLSLRDPGLFLIEVDLQKGKSALLAESVIMRELERLKNNPVKPEELQRSSNVMRFKFLERLVTAKGRAHLIGQLETGYGNLETGLEFQKKVYEVTPDQIQQAAQKYFDTSKLTVIVAVPKPKKAEKGAQ
jgi:zinc protease